MVSVELTYEELDAVLSKHPRRNTEDHVKYLCKTVRRALNTQRDPMLCRSDLSLKRVPDKAMRLIKEIELFPNMASEVFHLYILANIHVQTRFTRRYSDVTMLVNPEQIDEKIASVVRGSRRKTSGGISNPCTLYHFAEARRQIWSSLFWPYDACSSPHNQVDYDPFTGLILHCDRGRQLQLTEELQKWAYGEIRSGIMITLSARLPRELCLLVFEHAMAAEELPLNSRVWDEEILGGMTVRGPLKEPYQCPNCQTH